MKKGNVERAVQARKITYPQVERHCPEWHIQRDAHSGKHSKEIWGWECPEWPKWPLQFPCFGEFVC